MGSVANVANTGAAATKIATGTLAAGRLRCGYRSCGATATFRRFWSPRRSAERALAAVVQEAYVQGISTRSVDELVTAVGMTGISKSQMSRLCEEIEERVNAFLERPLEGDWPYLWNCAPYVKIRKGGRIVSVATTIAVAEPFWSPSVRSLTR